MNRYRMIALVLLVGVILALTGCAPPVIEDSQITEPGKIEASDVLGVLHERWQGAVGFRANGSCVWHYTEDGKDKDVQFPVKIWANPPGDFYLQGDILFDGKGLVIGTNNDRFWFVARPKEIRTYLWGQWGAAAEQQCFEKLTLPLNPGNLIEALGLIKIDESDLNDNWKIQSDGDEYVLTQYGSDGHAKERIYVTPGKYLVKRIEHFSRDGFVSVVAEMEKYFVVKDDFVIPSKIMVVRHLPGLKSDSALLTIKSAKPYKFNDKQKNVLFSLPDTKGFDQVLELDENCRFVEH